MDLLSIGEDVYWDNVPTRHIILPSKILSSINELYLFEYLAKGVPIAPPSLTLNSNTTVYCLQTESKTPLLKTPFTYSIEHEEI